VVGDLALFVVSGGIDWDELRERPQEYDLPASVLGFLRGELGEPAGGLPQPFARRALRAVEGDDAPAADAAPEDEPDGSDELHRRLADPGRDRRAALSAVMFPGPAKDRDEAVETYGDVSVIPTSGFFYGLRDGRELSIDLEPGVKLILELEAVSEPDERGMRTVLTRLNGQLRPIDVRDESIEAKVVDVERADPRDPSHVAAPLTGVVTVLVEARQDVEEGDAVAVLEAMKMESTITAPRAGKVERIAARSGSRLDQGDLVLVLDGG